jgi:alkylhydroperoxidase family enzyme
MALKHRFVALAVCVATAWLPQPTRAAEPAMKPFAPAPDTDAWKLLPREETPLPVWARVLAPSQPRTTALLLNLDYLHRTTTAVDADLRVKLRWIVADANRSVYCKSYAQYDGEKVGVDCKKWAASLASNDKQLPVAEFAAVQFARKLSLEASRVTDDDMAQLIKLFGERKVVAIVHLVAFANFQTRLMTAIGAEVEDLGPLPPTDAKFSTSPSKYTVPARPDWTAVREAKVAQVAKPDWRDLDIADVRKSMEQQKTRTSRIKLPPTESLDPLPADMRKRMEKVIWSNVSLGYQPQLTQAWFATMGSFSQEARLDPVFSSSLFWVVTRSVDCFY